MGQRLSAAGRRGGYVDAQRQGATLSALQAPLPERYTFSGRLQDYPTAQSQTLIAHLKEGSEAEVLTAMFGGIACEPDGADTTDGLRVYFAGGDITHLHPSGNVPKLRC